MTLLTLSDAKSSCVSCYISNCYHRKGQKGQKGHVLFFVYESKSRNIYVVYIGCGGIRHSPDSGSTAARFQIDLCWKIVFLYVTSPLVHERCRSCRHGGLRFDRCGGSFAAQLCRLMFRCRSLRPVKLMVRGYQGQTPLQM